MTTATLIRPTRDIPARPTRKAAMRGHICAAAREVFFAEGFAAPTMGRIADAAGVQRSTLYTHFRDKEEVLAAIVADYTVGVREVVARLPGPAPSQAEVDAWVAGFAAFAARERAPTELLVTSSGVANLPAALTRFGSNFVAMLAERSPAFVEALATPSSLTHAWAMAALRELGWALCFYAQQGDNEDTANRLSVAATLFGRFVRGER